MGKKILRIIIHIITIALILIENYRIITPWNVHSAAMWLKLFCIAGIFTIGEGIVLFTIKFDIDEEDAHTKRNERMKIIEKQKKWLTMMIGVIALPVICLLVLLVGSIGDMQIFRASSYKNMVEVKESTADTSIPSVDGLNSIALMDTQSAIQLGDRQIGQIEKFSAFEVATGYMQLNVNGDPVKVAPLVYKGFFKWKNNRDEGVPGYVTVSPTTMEAKYVQLNKGMKYVPSAYFGDNLFRHLHKQYPTTIMGYSHIEIDENGNPYYVTAVYKKKVGIFSGKVATGAILTDPVTGKSKKYALKDVPKWVDIVWDGDLICQDYNIANKNINGWWNGTGYGANTGCKRTTDDFGYIAKGNDIYIYTGVTSYASDNSNLGYIVVNSRTGEYSYFKSSGANEQSAMNAAQGEVQQYGYKASFPSLVNINGNLSYIGVLKDKNNLVKLYYLVNAEDYGKVVTNANRSECLKAYLSKIGSTEEIDESKDAGSENISVTENTSDASQLAEENEISFKIVKMQYVQSDGETYVYLVSENNDIYKCFFTNNEKILLVNVGDTVTGVVEDGFFKLK